MNKQIIYFLIFFQWSNLTFGQNPNGQSQYDKQAIVLKDSLKQIEERVKILTEKQEWKNEILEERLKQASDTIANQNSLVGGFSVIYTILTIFIAVLAIALPILTYQFGIKPSKIALKEFEHNIDKKLEDYLVNTRNLQIEKAIENLKSDNQELKTNAASYISLTQHQGFSDEQLFKLFMVLKSINIDQLTQGTIAHAISNRKSEYATDYFKEALKDSANTGIKYTGMRYFANIGIENYLEVFRQLVKQADNPMMEFFTILTNFANFNKATVSILINDTEFVDSLGHEGLKTVKQSVNGYKKHWNLPGGVLENSYLFKKLNEIS